MLLPNITSTSPSFDPSFFLSSFSSSTAFSDLPYSNYSRPPPPSYYSSAFRSSTFDFLLPFPAKSHAGTIAATTFGTREIRLPKITVKGDSQNAGVARKIFAAC